MQIYTPDIAADEDPTKPPSPSGGWSEVILPLDGARIYPSTGKGTQQEGGVYDSGNQFVHQAVLWRGTVPLNLPMQDPPKSAETHLSGTWLWGGILLNHFGHFLTETLARFWAYHHVKSEIDGILFLHKRNGEGYELHDRFFELAQIDAPTKIIREPTSVDRLLVPGQGFGLGAISYGTRSHHDFIRNHFAQHIEPGKSKKIYASRSALSASKGGAIAEIQIEEELAKDGYEIYHPQRDDLQKQVATYKGADKIIGLDGSALHLAGFCATENTDIAMIMRRSSNVSKNITFQLHGAMGKEPHVINRIEYDWVVKERGRVDRFSVGQLDLPGLGQDLHALGMVTSDHEWPKMSQKLIDEYIKDLSRATRTEYVQRQTQLGLRNLRQARRARRAAREQRRAQET